MLIIGATFFIGCSVFSHLEFEKTRERHKMTSEIAVSTNTIKLTATCNAYGFVTAPAEANCVDKDDFRYLNTGLSIGFFRVDADGIPHPVWAASLDPFVKQYPGTINNLRDIHSAFVTR